MAARTLYCTKCNHGIVVERDVPARCPSCGSSTWRSAQTPSVPYALNWNDRKFLKSIRVSPDDR